VIDLSRGLVHLGRAALATVAAVVLCKPALSAETQADVPPKEVQAIWKSQELSFYFQSFTTFYACRSLEDRVRMLLVELGADKSIKVRSTSCFGNEIARLPHLRINVTSPIEATPEALAELEKSRSTRELTARVRGERMAEGTEQFPAYWKPVSLSRGSLRLEPGDCELIDQLKRHVLPKLSIRLVKDNVSCSPNQVSMSQPRLEVEALTAMPRPDEKSTEKKDPAPAEEKKD
jgi:hypothetical protein